MMATTKSPSWQRRGSDEPLPRLELLDVQAQYAGAAINDGGAHAGGAGQDVVREEARGHDLGVVERCIALACRQFGLRYQRGTAHLPAAEHDVARSYVLYRAKHMEERRLKKEAAGATATAEPQINVTENGVARPLVMQEVRDLIGAACKGLEKHVDADAILAETVKNLYDGVPVKNCTSPPSWLPAR